MEIHDEPLSGAVGRLRTGDLRPTEYVATVCRRVDALDPDLRAMVSEPDRAGRLDAEARALEEGYKGSAGRPSLYGVPVGVKDIFHVDGLPTRAGSQLPPEALDGPEAACVRRLRDAGALIAGKTVTTEFAGPDAPGLTRNPHDLGHTPGGSSSGSAAGVAAGLFPLALGTQTGGSVLRPAAFCGVVGVKPSSGRVPGDGVLPYAASVDQVGWFTQDVPGTRTAARVLCDDWDAAADVDRDAPRLGVPAGPFLDQVSGEGRRVFRSQLATLEEAGATVERVRVPAFEDLDRLREVFHWVTRGELALAHHERFEMYAPFYRAGTVEQLREGREVTVGDLARGRARAGSLRAELDGLLAEHSLDAWVTPAALGPAPAGITSIGGAGMNWPWTYAGLPAVSVPAGSVDDLPVGLQLVGSFGGDERLLRWAARVEGGLDETPA